MTSFQSYQCTFKDFFIDFQFCGIVFYLKFSIWNWILAVIWMDRWNMLHITCLTQHDHGWPEMGRFLPSISVHLGYVTWYQITRIIPNINDIHNQRLHLSFEPSSSPSISIVVSGWTRPLGGVADHAVVFLALLWPFHLLSYSFNSLIVSIASAKYCIIYIYILYIHCILYK